jgi:hypothetical protein
LAKLLRRQIGKGYDAKTIRIGYDPSADQNPEHLMKNTPRQKPAQTVVTLGQQRGNLAAKLDASAAIWRKAYDDKSADFTMPKKFVTFKRPPEARNPKALFRLHVLHICLTAISSQGRNTPRTLGRAILSEPLEWFHRHLRTTAKQRQSWRLVSGGVGVHWGIWMRTF